MIELREAYTEALSFYNKTNRQDAHAHDVRRMLQRIGQEDIPEIEMKNVTRHSESNIGSSSSNEAYENSCYELLERMPVGSTKAGDIREIWNYGNCHLRLSPYEGTYTDQCHSLHYSLDWAVDQPRM